MKKDHLVQVVHLKALRTKECIMINKFRSTCELPDYTGGRASLWKIVTELIHSKYMDNATRKEQQSNETIHQE
jgi:hypothetical protein